MDSSTEALFFIDTKHGSSDVDNDISAPITREDGDDKGQDVVLGEDDEELELEMLVFGGNPDKLFEEEKGSCELQNDLQDVVEEETEKNQSNFEIDEGESIEGSKKRKPAWIDEDDDELSIDIKDQKRLRKLREAESEVSVSGGEFEKRLRSQFEKLVGAPKWASMDKKIQDSDDDDDDFLTTTRNYLGKSENLPQTLIDIRRVKDANHAKMSNAGVKCIEFHPTSKVLLTAGLNNTLDLFQIDSETNPKIQTIFLKGFPIYKAHFTANGQQIILSSQRRYFYVFDLTTGDTTKIPGIKGRAEKSLEDFVISPDGSCIAFLGESGYIHLVSIKSKQYISSLKMSGAVNAAAFSKDGSQLFSFGGDGEVYIWDMRTKRCKHKFADEGCLKGTCIAVSGDGCYVACGSNSGVVNIYDEECFNKRNPKPVKTVLNLTTSIHTVKFNPTSEILAISSRATKDSLKLLHMLSFTVFSNWPTRKGAFGYIQSLDFSSQSGYLAVGNDAGRATLFRLRHFPDA